MPSALLRIAIVLSLAVLGGCISKITQGTVREKASRDLSCDEAKIQVEEVEAPPKTYRAEGCGRKALYRCDSWDSYEQQPICHLQR
jgi:hypothetical protein